MLRAWMSIGIILSLVFVSVPKAVNAQGSDADELRETAVYERFVSVLERNPRRGTAFDKVYAYHVERGTVDVLLKTYRARVSTAPAADSSPFWMIVGLIEARRGQDVAAEEAFAKAESLDESNALAPYYHGQSLVALGQSDKAADAFERAIRRKPAPPDLLDVFQALGRVYQRAQKSRQALDVWNRLEQQFPRDAHVQEQIATILLEENDFASALPRFENLVQSTKDKYRQSLFQVEVAEIKARLNRNEDALHDFEKLLAELNPDNWLSRDVRRRIENIFLRTDDQKGLIAYYETWLKRDPKDLEAISRLAHILFSAGRAAESRIWLQEGLKLAPSKKELRQTLIGQLVYDRRFAEAVTQYELLDKYDPNNPDTIREWGRTILKDSSRDVATRKQQAAAVWRTLLKIRPNDAPVTSQTADLFRQAEMVDEALELYRRAIELAPEAIQYREYLGEYLHTLKRTDEALDAWRQMVADSRMTATNAARLAEVLAKFGHLQEAERTNADACRLDPKNFSLQLKQADLLSRTDQHAAALKQLALAEGLASTDEERESLLQRELTELGSTGQLNARIAQVRLDLENHPAPGTDGNSAGEAIVQRAAQRWYWLARAFESVNQINAAAQAIARAHNQQPESVTILRSAARIYESQHNLAAAADCNRMLAQIAPRFRIECLKRLAAMESRRGHREPALQAGRDLVAAAPGNPEIAEFHAQLCFRWGRHDEGIQALRRLLRITPGDVAILKQLAAALAERGHASEAIEVLWQAFRTSNRRDERQAVVQDMARMYSKKGQFQQLCSRLERESRDPNQHREMTLCLAGAYEAAGQSAEAQKTLETLLTDDSRDVELLLQLSKLAELRNEFATAIRYQRQLLNISNDRADRIRLSRLMIQAGDSDEAVELLSQVSGSHELTADVLSMLDSLFAQGRTDVVLAQLHILRERDPENWELLYREGVALASMKSRDAEKRFEAILAARHPDDEPSLLQQAVNAWGPGASGGKLPWYDRLSEVAEIQRSVHSFLLSRAGINGQPVARTTARGRTTSRTQVIQARWIPRDYGAARLAAWGWLITNDGKLHTQMDAFLSAHLPDHDQQPRRNMLLDRLAIHSFSGSATEKIETARQFAQSFADDADAAAIFIGSFPDRNAVTFQVAQNGIVTRSTTMNRPALDDATLADAVQAYERIAARPDLVPLNVTLVISLAIELRSAGKTQQAAEVLDSAITKVTTREEIARLLYETTQSSHIRTTSRLLDKLIELDRNSSVTLSMPTGTFATQNLFPGMVARLLWPCVSKSREPVDELLQVWNRYVRWHALCPPIGPNAQIQGIATGRVGAVNASSVNARIAVPRVPVDLTEPVIVNFNSFLSASGGLCPEALELLRLIRGEFIRTRRSDDLIAFLTSSSESEEISNAERVLCEQALAIVMWSEGRKNGALPVFSKIAERFPEAPNLQLNLAALYEAAGHSKQGLEIAEATHVESGELQIDREKLVLKLAIAAGATDRARQGAKRLYEMQIPATDSLPLAEQMIELGMLTEAQEILERDRKLQGDLRAQRIVMDLNLIQGRHEQATSVAEQLLKKLPISDVPAQRTNAPRVVDGRTYVVQETIPGISVSDYHNAAYRVLKQTGRLTQLIDQAEVEFENSPDSEPLIGALIAYHKAAGNQERVDKLTARRQEMQTDTPANKYFAAINFLEMNRPDEAVEKISVLIEKQPTYFASRCADIVFRFESRNELRRLAKMLEQAQWSRLEKYPETLPYVIDKLEDGVVTGDIARRLFLKEWNAKPERRVGLLSRISAESLWKLPEIADSLRTLTIPKDGSHVANQWNLFGKELRRESDGVSVLTTLSRILSSMAAQNQLDAMSLEVAQGIQQWPEWTAGQVLSGLIDLRRGRIEEGTTTLAKALPIVDPDHKRPLVACKIARELLPYESAFDLVLKYQMLAIEGFGKDSPKKTSELGVLARFLAHRGRNSDARRLLLESLPATLRRPAVVENDPTYNELQFADSIGRELRSMDFTVDAIDVYLTALNRSEGMKRVGGYDPRTTLQSSLVVAFGILTAEDFVKSLESRQVSDPSFDLHLFVPQRNEVGQIQSRWDNIFRSMVRDQGLLARTRIALAQMRERRPDDLAPFILSVWLAFETSEDKQIHQSLSALTASIERFDTARKQEFADPINEANTRRKHESLNETTALWLVARECLKHPSSMEIGRQLGDRALEASRRSFYSAILAEWIEIATSTSDTETVDRLKQKLDD